MLRAITSHILTYGCSTRTLVIQPQRHSAYIYLRSKVYKILILAYLIGQDPLATMQTFELDAKFGSMSECKKELTLQLPDGRYEVINEFVIDKDLQWDWLVAGCQKEDGSEEFTVEPVYPNGKPKELQGLDFMPGTKT